MSKKVLIVDDTESWHSQWKGDLEEKGINAVVLSAYSIEEAEKLFELNPDVDVIVMDACVPGNTPTTGPLVRKFRKTFNGPIIGVSSDKKYREILIRAGCNCESTKDDLSKLLFK